MIVTFFTGFLFSCSKVSDAKVGVIANFVYYGKTRLNLEGFSLIQEEWQFMQINVLMS